eukprot:SAG11_NODE_28259_length_323_cov_2.040179_2_plen_39_part_01
MKPTQPTNLHRWRHHHLVRERVSDLRDIVQCQKLLTSKI